MENASTIWESGKRELAKQLSPQTWIFEGLGEGDQSTLKTCFFLPLPLVIMTFFIFRMFSGKNPSAVDARRLHDCLTRIRQLEAQAHERPSQEIQRLEAKIGQLQWVHAEVKQELEESRASERQRQEENLKLTQDKKKLEVIAEDRKEKLEKAEKKDQIQKDAIVALEKKVEDQAKTIETMRKLVDFGSAFHKMNDFLDRQAEEKVELVKEVRSLRDKVQELETAKMRLEEEVRSSRQRQNAPVLTNPGPLELRTHGRPIEDPSRTHGRSSARLWGESDATDSSSDTHRPLFRNQNGCVRGPPASSLPSPPRHPGFSQGPRYGYSYPLHPVLNSTVLNSTAASRSPLEVPPLFGPSRSPPLQTQSTQNSSYGSMC